ncbi:MAG: STAS domain-containing protein, partial [Oscillatoria sp. Prado101]|nr:STAS domain-containing protein [Oscillatoria sp. Prado101]
SSGLFSLIAGLSTARQHGCRLVLCNLKATVRLVFEISQLDTVFEIFDSYDTVLVSLDRDAASLRAAA